MKRIAIILVGLLFTLACAPLEFAKSILNAYNLATSAPATTEVPSATWTPASTPTTDEVNKAVLYEEDFSSDQSNWSVQNDAESQYTISEGEYFIHVIKSDYSFFNISNESAPNYVLNVDLRHVSGDDENTGGMILWRYADNDNFYALSIMDDGTYYIHRFLKGEYGMIKLPASSALLNKSGSTNKVTIAVHGDRNDLFFNDQFEYSFQDTSIPEGTFGLGAQPSLSSEVEVAFDDLKVYRYDPANEFTPADPQLTPTPEYQAITWQQLTQFLAEDHTNWHEYDLEDYNCVDFAIDLVSNARYSAINARIVTVQFVGQETGHAFVAFETTDRGTVFVEPQGDNTYSNVEIGNDLCDDWGDFECMGTIESIQYFGECDHAQNCTVLP